MPKFAFHVRFRPAPGQEQAVEEFLHWAQPQIVAEPGTMTWYAVRDEDGSYAIFDTFDDEEARQAHLHGRVGDRLRALAEAGVVFAEPPAIHRLAVLAFDEKRRV